MKKHSTSFIPQWNELDFYKEGQKIYGRDEEIWKVSNGIISNLQTIIYGRSGIGKSSLLFAGVFPKLRKESFFPVFVRLGMRNENSYTEAVINEVLDEAHRTKKDINKVYIKAHYIPDDIYVDSKTNPAHNLYDFFNKTQFVEPEGSLRVPVLVFDQFEEVLNNRETHEKAVSFLKELYSLIDDNSIYRHEFMSYDNFRVVISLREDYLYCLEDVIDKFNLTDFKFNRFRISAMSEKNAREVIIKTSGECIESGRENDICNWIIQKSKNYMGEINTLILSLICSTCYLNAKDNIIKYADLKGCEDYLYRYYLSKLDNVPSYTRKYLENKLITSDGRRGSLDMKEAINSGLISKEEIERLSDIRLLRVVISGDNTKRIEFVHDKLTSVINSHKRTYVDRLVHVFKNAFVFSGTSDKQEWAITAYPLIILAFLYPFLNKTSLSPDLLSISENVWRYLILLFAIVNFSTSVRRCHDIGESGWNFLKHYWSLGIKSSSAIKYDGNLSTVSWRKIQLHLSLTSLEYKALNLYGIYVFVLLIIFLELLPTSTVMMLNVLLFLALIYWGSVFIARLSSLTYIFDGIIPILNIKYWFQAFRTYDNEEIKHLNRFKVVCCGFFAINNNALIVLLINYIWKIVKEGVNGL